jgi:hypothetical protein
MLYANQLNHVTFRVNVAGSSTEPTARLIIGRVPELCFDAVKGDDGLFHVDMVPPGDLAGEQPLRVEVLLNSRLFVPLKHTVSVLDVDAMLVQPVQLPVEPPVDLPLEPIQLEPADEPQAALVPALSLVDEPVPSGEGSMFTQDEVRQRAQAVPAEERAVVRRMFTPDDFKFNYTPRLVPEAAVPAAKLHLDHLASIKLPPRVKKSTKDIIEGAEGSNIKISRLGVELL